MSNLQPTVTIKNGEPVTNSRDVAEFFQKDHSNLIKRIRGIVENDATPASWYKIAKYTHEQNGQVYVSYDMTRDGFTMLVLGFTGDKATRFKIAYINRFNEMEEQLANQNPAPALPDFSDPAVAARAWADQYEKTKTLQIENAKQKEILENITVDTYRTMYKQEYWNKSTTGKLAQKACKLATQKGLELDEEMRDITLPSGNILRKPVKKYPKKLLDEAYWLTFGSKGPQPWQAR